MTTIHPLSDRPAWQPIAIGIVVALVAGGLAYYLSCLLVWPEQVAHGFGEQWQQMSKDPFALYGQLPHRLLAPLLAYLTGFGGDGYLVFTRGLAVVMLASVFLFCRHRGSRPVDALLVTLAIAITAPVQMYKQHWVGYTDPLCYTLFLWAAMAARHSLLFWLLLLANLLNHELAAFLLPWLWFLRRQQDNRWRLDVICAGAVLTLYGAYYLWVKAHAAQQVYNADYFLAHPLFPGGTVAVWLLAFVHWTVAFGPMLALLAWHQHSRPRGTDPRDSERWHLWLVLGSVLLIFCIAFDWARHANLILLPLVVASVRFLELGARHRLVYVGLLVVTVVLFWQVPPWSPTAWPTNYLVDGTPAWRQAHPGWHPIQFLVDSGVVVIVPGGFGFGPLSASVGKWLPQVWHLLLSILGILAAIWLAGALFARWRKLAAVPAA